MNNESKIFSADVCDKKRVLIINGNNNNAQHSNCLLIKCNGVTTTGDNQIWIKDRLIDYSKLSDDAKEVVDCLLTLRK